MLDRCRCVLASGKTVLPEIGAVDLAVPRDRSGTFEPQIVRKGQTRLDGFNDRVIALYARGMMVRDIRAHLREMYQVEVSPDLISQVCSGPGCPGLGQLTLPCGRSERHSTQALTAIAQCGQGPSLATVSGAMGVSDSRCASCDRRCTRHRPGSTLRRDLGAMRPEIRPCRQRRWRGRRWGTGRPKVSALPTDVRPRSALPTDVRLRAALSTGSCLAS